MGKDKLYLGITFIPQQTNISNEKFSATSVLNYKKGTSVNFALDGAYFFSRIAGINIGAGFGSYSTKLSMDSYSIKFQTVDSENESYEMRISGTSIVENQKISFLSIPVCLALRFPAGNKFGFYLKGGMSFEIPVVKTYEGTGTFTYDGYYSAYPILLQDLPAYGFPSNLNTSASGTLQIKSFNTALVASGGAFFSVNKVIQLVLGAYFSKSLANISAYKPDSSFRLTSAANELNSFMAGSSSAGIQAFGLSFGVRFFLK